jgi:hypothetical protein
MVLNNRFGFGKRRGYDNLKTLLINNIIYLGIYL